ncbi:uncharacterized protein LOC111085004 isoform X2 [Limulus polyphemus]|uniref:Uncharacterized protein LOC111085004 isoform X2 n=1 Tax=Limulus polyphemus TaxID=6850 RepID=A0ABM1S1U2_LIMPO|nr:uncharacterized protein LOC111085004 isoform X2 [Limulus polyphemus]
MVNYKYEAQRSTEKTIVISSCQTPLLCNSFLHHWKSPWILLINQMFPHLQNIQLQADKETLYKELEQKHKLLQDSLCILEKLEHHNGKEIEELKQKMDDEKSHLEEKVVTLEQAHLSSRKEGTDTSKGSANFSQEYLLGEIQRLTIELQLQEDSNKVCIYIYEKTLIVLQV